MNLYSWIKWWTSITLALYNRDRKKAFKILLGTISYDWMPLDLHKIICSFHFNFSFSLFNQYSCLLNAIPLFCVLFFIFQSLWTMMRLAVQLSNSQKKGNEMRMMAHSASLFPCITCDCWCRLRYFCRIKQSSPLYQTDNITAFAYSAELLYPESHIKHLIHTKYKIKKCKPTEFNKQWPYAFVASYFVALPL